MRILSVLVVAAAATLGVLDSQASAQHTLGSNSATIPIPPSMVPVTVSWNVDSDGLLTETISIAGGIANQSHSWSAMGGGCNPMMLGKYPVDNIGHSVHTEACSGVYCRDGQQHVGIQSSLYLDQLIDPTNLFAGPDKKEIARFLNEDFLLPAGACPGSSGPATTTGGSAPAFDPSREAVIAVANAGGMHLFWTRDSDKPNNLRVRFVSPSGQDVGAFPNYPDGLTLNQALTRHEDYVDGPTWTRQCGTRNCTMKIDVYANNVQCAYQQITESGGDYTNKFVCADGTSTTVEVQLVP